MKNIDKKSLVIIVVLLVNICCITVPYSIKNNDLQKQIKSNKNSVLESKKEYDFYEILNEFKNSINTLGIKSKVTAQITDEKMYINLELQEGVKSTLNTLLYIQKNLPMLNVFESNIDKMSCKIVFILEN